MPSRLAYGVEAIILMEYIMPSLHIAERKGSHSWRNSKRNDFWLDSIRMYKISAKRPGTIDILSCTPSR